MKRLLICLSISFSCFLYGMAVTINMADYGIKPSVKNNSPRLQKALAQIKSRYAGQEVTLQFAPGVYNFAPQGSANRNYYISNHDNPEWRSVGFAIEGWEKLTIDGRGAEFNFSGRMIPFAVIDSKDCTLRNFSIDFANPHISQCTIVSQDDNGIVLQLAPWVKHRVYNDALEIYGDGWTEHPHYGIAFEPATRRMVYRTSDVWCGLDSVISMGNGCYHAPKWKNERLVTGTVVALRCSERPCPAIFLYQDSNTNVEQVKVHYAQGMGLLAQTCENITLDGFSVCLRGDEDPRYFTTHADATHFSGCKGHITSTNGLYEAMMDDAINVHGTYLKVGTQEDRRTLTARYMHPQAYGFLWGETGDSVQVISTRTMERLGAPLTISAIEAIDAPTHHGAKEYRITFASDLPEELTAEGSFGLENLTWCPTVLFSGNTIRNNRARGTLFSTPCRTEVIDNVFDHTSGSAILLCGDCNGWYETGACREVVIRNNRFINAVTNMFQFTEAVISIYPVIPELSKQQEYFHGGIDVPGVIIEDNVFETFDAPLVYAKSICGLRFDRNTINSNNDYPAFHANPYSFRLIRTKNVEIGSSNAYINYTPTMKLD